MEPLVLKQLDRDNYLTVVRNTVERNTYRVTKGEEFRLVAVRLDCDTFSDLEIIAVMSFYQKDRNQINFTLSDSDSFRFAIKAEVIHLPQLYKKKV